MVVAILECNGVVGMDRHDREGSFETHLDLVTGFTAALHVHAVAGLIVVVRPASILAEESLINTSLPHVMDLYDIGKEGNVEEHVSIEHNGTR